MGRKVNYALKYFPVTVNMDRDPKMLHAKYLMGDQAEELFEITLKLLMWIYGNDGGYYTQWGDLSHIIFSEEKLSIEKADVVTRAIECLIQAKFFDAHMYQTYQILTSHGIQVIWKDVIDRVKGKATINPLYDLINSGSDVITSEVKSAEKEDMQQSKVNRSKVDESKIDINLLSKGEQENFSPAGGVEGAAENFMPRPENPPPKIDAEARHSLDVCIEYVFQSGLYIEDLYKIAFTYNIKNEKGHFDYDKLYRWGLAFNRWQQKMNRGDKTLKNWHEHLSKWLANQPLDANPDEINQPKNGQSNSKNQKLYGIDREEAGNFYTRNRKIDRNTGPTPPGAPAT